MPALRTLFRNHRHVAALLLAAAMGVRALVPAGYMPEAGAQMLRITICSSIGGRETSRQIAVPLRGHSEQRRAGPCAFGALTGGALGGADPFELTQAPVFAGLPAQFWPERSSPPLTARLRPPLRGPPARA